MSGWDGFWIFLGIVTAIEYWYEAKMQELEFNRELHDLPEEEDTTKKWWQFWKKE